LLKTKAFNNQQLQWNSISNGNITHYNGIIISTTNVTNFNGILEYYLQISLTYNGIESTNVTYFIGINWNIGIISTNISYVRYENKLTQNIRATDI
jgi:hypothetical protein